MSTSELKSSLHSLIDQANDSAMLEAIHELLSNVEHVDDSNSTISVEERKSIEKGLVDIKNGRVVPHEVVMENARDRINLR
jgi:predicted transcriptional regulator